MQPAVSPGCRPLRPNIGSRIGIGGESVTPSTTVAETAQSEPRGLCALTYIPALRQIWLTNRRSRLIDKCDASLFSFYFSSPSARASTRELINICIFFLFFFSVFFFSFHYGIHREADESRSLRGSALFNRLGEYILSYWISRWKNSSPDSASLIVEISLGTFAYAEGIDLSSSLSRRNRLGFYDPGLWKNVSRSKWVSLNYSLGGVRWK